MKSDSKCNLQGASNQGIEIASGNKSTKAYPYPGFFLQKASTKHRKQRCE